MPSRPRLLRRAVGLEIFTVVYNILEGVVAIASGLAATSVALIGFGLDSAIETLAAVVVLRRFQGEIRSSRGAPHGPPEASGSDRRAERIVGATLLALAAYVAFESIATLLQRRAPEESPVGIVLAAASLAVMPLLAAFKVRTARALGSRALLADAKETLACAYLSFTLLTGLVLHAAAGWWWADPLAAFAMIPFIAREGLEAWRGENEELDRDEGHKAHEAYANPEEHDDGRDASPPSPEVEELRP